MNKAFNFFEWWNEPDERSPLNRSNLMKINHGLEEVDNRVISLDTTKLSKTEAQGLIKSLTFNPDNGVFTVTYYNGATATIDTLLEKLAVNFDFDEDTQKMIIYLADGTTKEVDLSAFIVPLEFIDSDTIDFQILETGKVTAIVKEGSIQEKHLRPDYLADIKVEVAKAESAATAADASKTEAAASASTASTKAGEAATSASNAANSATIAETSKTAAGISEQNSANSATAAADSAATASAKAGEATESAENASGHANTATSKANEAAASADNAVASATSADTYAKKSQSYAVGGTGTREGEDADNAKYYYEQTKRISQSKNGMIPMGTITFAELSNPDNQQTGYFFNISDSFVSDERFKDGSGIFYGAGNNVLRTADGFWDVTAASMVSGVKGNSETEYRQGFVNLTPANIGAVNKSGDSMSGTLGSSKTTGTYLSGNQGQAIINSTASAGAYTMLDKLNSTNGYFTDGVYHGTRLFQYTAKETVDAGTNRVTKSVTILDESGNSWFPGTVTAKEFAGNAATATKASQDKNGNDIVATYQTKNGDSKNNTVTFTSGDKTDPIAWADVAPLTSGEKHSSIFNKLSTMFRNVRYIWQLIGNTQLSIGDGTITGAINEINTRLTPISLPVEIFESEYISEGPNVIVEYVSGIATILVYFALGKSMSAWTSIEIAQVRGARFGVAYSTTATIGDNAAALLITINESGKILVMAQGAVTKTGWYHTSFPARCFYTG